MIRALNLYCGLGGNRKLWPQDVKVTAIEINPEIAEIYKNFFPNDKVILTDAHEYLLNNYKDFDFIWTSPPCQTNSLMFLSNAKPGNFAPLYPDLSLYQEILFLKHFAAVPWVVENVNPYYKPLIRAQEVGRHLIWANFHITNKKIKPLANYSRAPREELVKYLGIDPGKNIYFSNSHDPNRVLRNCFHPELGQHIFNCAFATQQNKILNYGVKA